MGVALVLLDLFQEGLGTGMGDSAEVLDQFPLRHSDAGVGDGDRIGLVIGGDEDLQRPFGLEDRSLGGLSQELELLVGIGRV
jgi:hypothetical protein